MNSLNQNLNPWMLGSLGNDLLKTMGTCWTVLVSVLPMIVAGFMGSCNFQRDSPGLTCSSKTSRCSRLFTKAVLSQRQCRSVDPQ